MTKEEVLRFRGGKMKSTSRAQRLSAEQMEFVRIHESNDAQLLPKSFDWCTARPGVVGRVKDQAFCGSCWAFGFMGPVESMVAIQTGRHVVLPEQFAIDCAWKSTPNQTGNAGCGGGNPDATASQIIKLFGGVIPTAASYGGYLSMNGYCKNTRHMEMGAKISGWVYIKNRDEKGLLHALVTKGPINVDIMVPDEMTFYDSGVLNVESCRHKITEIDHAVVLVGYGTDEHGTDYYTIRNSWSTYWGEEGYIRIARGKFDCAVTSEAGYPVVDSVVPEHLIL